MFSSIPVAVLEITGWIKFNVVVVVGGVGEERVCVGTGHIVGCTISKHNLEGTGILWVSKKWETFVGGIIVVVMRVLVVCVASYVTVIDQTSVAVYSCGGTS